MRRDIEGFKKWLEEMGRSPITARVYETMLRLGEKGLRDPDLAPKTRHTIRAALRSWADYTEDQALMKRLDARHLRLPSPKRQNPRPPLATSEWRRLREAVRALPDEPTALVCKMMIDRGFRVGDVLRMTRRDIQEGVTTGVLAFTAKQGNRLQYRAKRILPHLRALLEHGGGWRRVEDLVSPAAEDKRDAARQQVSRLLKQIAAETGLDPRLMHPHRLRRTYSVEFLKALGPDPNGLSKLVQHMQWGGIEMAMEYVGYVSDEELAEIEDQLD